MTERRPYFWRMLRSDFLDMCDRNVTAALLLDYFHTNEVTSMGRRTQGARDGGFYELSRTFASAVVLIDVGKNTVNAAMNLLIGKGYITPHPDNGKPGWSNRNRYRPNMDAILQATEAWALAGADRSGQTSYSFQPDLSIGLARPINRSSQTDYSIQPDPSIGLAGPQDLVSNQDSNRDIDLRAAAATPPPPPPSATSTIDSLITAYLGRQPSPLELQRAASLVKQHGHERTRAAIEDAAAKGGRSIKYVEQIANNANPRAAANDASRPEADWSNYRRVSPEEAATMLRGASRKGSAS